MSIASHLICYSWTPKCGIQKTTMIYHDRRRGLKLHSPKRYMEYMEECMEYSRKTCDELRWNSWCAKCVNNPNPINWTLLILWFFIHVQVSVQTANNSPPREAGAHPQTGVCVESLASVKVHESLVQGGHKLPCRACSSGKCRMRLIDFALCYHLGSFFTKVAGKTQYVRRCSMGHRHRFLVVRRIALQCLGHVSITVYGNTKALREAFWGKCFRDYIVSIRVSLGYRLGIALRIAFGMPQAQGRKGKKIESNNSTL